MAIGIAALCGLAATACGGGGGSSGAPAPSTDPTGPTAPDPPAVPANPAALAGPLSTTLLCGNGLDKRHRSLTADAFASVASERGIDHTHAVASPRWTEPPDALETVMRSGAVLAGELTGDCWPDLLFVTGGTDGNQLAAYDNQRGNDFGRRDLSLEPSATLLGAIGLADLDADYRNDLVIGNLLSGATRVYLARADGGFALTQEFAMPGSTLGFAFGDFAGDAWLDVYAAHWGLNPPAASGPAALRNTGGDSQPSAALVDADLATGTVQTDVAAGREVSPSLADLNGDGRLDLMIAADAGASELLIDTGSQFFVSRSGEIDLSALAGAGSAVRDFDNDGRWDWFVASPRDPGDGRPWPWAASGNRLYWGQDDSPYLGTGSTPTGAEDAAWPWGVCAQDFDNDGWVDLFVENGYGFAPEEVLAAASGHPFLAQIDESLHDQKLARARVFRNQGDRTFADVSPDWGVESLSNGRGVACLDYDRDGDIDIAVAQNSGAPILYENQHAAADGNHFIALSLYSGAPNTYAVGAVVEVEAGGRIQRRQVGAAGNFLGQDAYALHFGLGTATTADRIRLHWPGGPVQELTDIRADRFLSLLDPRLIAYSDATRQARILDALADAAAYVAEHPENLTDDTLAFLPMMQRQHGLVLPYEPVIEIESRIGALEEEGNLARARSLRAYRRMFDAGYEIPAADFAGLSGLDAITLASVYCHQFPLVAADIAEIEALVDRGNYDTTHALLAMLLAIDNNCAMPDSFQQSLIGDIEVAVHGIAARNADQAVTDLTIEAMTFLAGAGRHDLIEPLWIDRFLEVQQADGAFKAAPEETESSGHTTGLALWLLLQLADPVQSRPGLTAQAWD